jgi:hypothetical protein
MYILSVCSRVPFPYHFIEVDGGSLRRVDASKVNNELAVDEDEQVVITCILHVIEQSMEKSDPLLK